MVEESKSPDISDSETDTNLKPKLLTEKNILRCEDAAQGESVGGERSNCRFNQNGDTYYVKGGYHNEAVLAEITAAMLAGLTGVTVPDIKTGLGFATHENSGLADTVNKRHDVIKDDDGTLRHQHDEPILFIASKELKGFYDLGPFLKEVVTGNPEAFCAEGKAETFLAHREKPHHPT